MYWAVKAGFEGPKIYTSWEDGAQPNVEGFQGAWFKSFRTLVMAQTWLDASDPGLAEGATNLIISRAVQYLSLLPETVNSTASSSVSPPRPRSIKRSSSTSEASPRPPVKRERLTQEFVTPTSPLLSPLIKSEREATPTPMVIDLSNEPETPPRVKQEAMSTPGPSGVRRFDRPGPSTRTFVDLTQASPERNAPIPPQHASGHVIKAEGDTFTFPPPNMFPFPPPPPPPTGTPSRPVRNYSPPTDPVPQVPQPMDQTAGAGPSKGRVGPYVVNPRAPIHLSDEQQRILEMVLAGESLFFTGSAGTGKSVLLREIIAQLRERDIEVAVTASTGIASINIGGSTLHSFAGCGLAKGPKEKLAESVKSGGFAAERWLKTKVLIIDEISMIDGALFDKFEYVARIARKSDEPFGGLQLVLCGDFYQLPPVPDVHDGLNLPTLFAFQAESWEQCVPRICMLTQVFRQKEQEFVDILNHMRLGNLSPAAIKRFSGLSREVVYPDQLRPTELYPTRREVDNANNARLRELPLPEMVYDARDLPGYNAQGERISMREAKKLLERMVAAESVTLRIGAQVMLIHNLVQGRLANGTIGRVSAFMTVRQGNEARIKIAQLDANKKGDFSGVPRLPPDLQNKQWPVIIFENGDECLCPPLTFEVVNVFGEIEATRWQVPLILGWAMTIHKSQGQTLGRVKVNLNRIFEKGQAYVAISRATSLESLQILNFQPMKVQAHERVIEFSRKLLAASSMTTTTGSEKPAAFAEKAPSKPNPFGEAEKDSGYESDEWDDDLAAQAWHDAGE